MGAVAIIKNAPDMEAAKKFVDWALTKKAQEIGQHNNSYQFLTNPEANPPEEAMKFKDAKLIDYNFQYRRQPCPSPGSMEQGSERIMGAKGKIGLIGLAVMGANLARNLAGHGISTVVYNRSHDKTENFS